MTINEPNMTGEAEGLSFFIGVSVSDTGSGMDEETKKKCFTHFGGAKQMKDINKGGMGLGLSASTQICRSLKGDLYLIRSEIGEGTKIHFIMEVKLGAEVQTSSLSSSE